MRTIEYRTQTDAREYSIAPIVFSILSPFFTLPAFVIGTVFLQDELVRGDGTSWYRAALYAAAPTVVVTLGALVAGLSYSLKKRRLRWVAILAILLNGVAIGMIVGGVLSASER